MEVVLDCTRVLGSVLANLVVACSSSRTIILALMLAHRHI
jgi:hypothetical protein